MHAIYTALPSHGDLRAMFAKPVGRFSMQIIVGRHLSAETLPGNGTSRSFCDNIEQESERGRESPVSNGDSPWIEARFDYLAN